MELSLSYITEKLKRGLVLGKCIFEKRPNDPTRLQDFFNTIGKENLVFEEARLTESVGSIQINGQIDDLFGFGRMQVLLRFYKEEHVNTHLVASLINPEETIKFRTFWLPLNHIVFNLDLKGQHNVSLFTIAGDVQIAPYQLNGSISYRNSIRIQMTRLSENDWQVTLVSTDNKKIELSDFVTAFFNYTDGTIPFASFFPKEINTILKDIEVSHLSSLFNTADNRISHFEAGIRIPVSWDLIPNKLVIKNPTLSLTVLAPFVTASREIFGSIKGEIDIASTKTEVILNGSSTLWTFELLPVSSGSISIPSISHVFDLAHIDQGNLPDVLQTLPGLSLEQLSIDFNRTDLSFTKFSTRISTSSPWLIIENYLSLERIVVDVTLEKELNWEFTAGGIGAVWKFGNSVEILFGAEANHKNWMFYGALVRPVDFKELLRNNLSLPNNFPSIILENANVSLIPATKNFHFDGMVDIKQDHKDALGIPVSISRIGGSFDLKNQNNQRIYDGKIHLEIILAGLTVLLDAQLTNSSGNTGLVFHGQVDGVVHMTNLIDEVKQKFNIGTIDVPEPIKSLTLKNLSVSFNSLTKNFAFSGDAEFDVDGEKVDTNFKINVTKNSLSGYDVEIKGIILIENIEFDIIFHKEASENVFVARYRPQNTAKPDAISLSKLVRPLVGAGIADIPDLTIIPEQLILGIDKTSSAKTKVIFKLATSIVADLSKLPLIGDAMPDGKGFKIDELGVLITNADWAVRDLSKLNTLIPDVGMKFSLTAAITDRFKPLVNGISLDLSALGIPKSINDGILDDFNDKKAIAGSNLPPSKVLTNSANPVTTRPGKWFPINKKIGAVLIKKIGLVPHQKTIFFLIDGNIELGGLGFEADGLGIGFDILNGFKPSFHLDGLGLELKKGSLEIEGAFLHNQIKLNCAGKEKLVDQYAGGAVVRVPKIGLSALGAYAKTCNDSASLFIYAAVNAPIAGIPGIIMINGVALAFGYNRRLIAPSIDNVATFPLVAEAVGGAVKLDLETALEKVNKYIPISSGEMFFGAGLKFTTFNLLDSFAFLALSFGKNFQVDILGLSTLMVPPQSNATPLAEIQIALKASIVPDDGIVEIEGRLTAASYVLSTSCHLTGGFAFYSWLTGEHAGDFVVSVGGYHPKFSVPSHYPKVPRLGFNWQVNGEVSLKGGMYFALTPVAFMAGGFLDALYHSGSVKAWFKAGADFLISWKPYHYDARLYVNLGASVTFWFFGTQTISVSVGADLHIWGPDFAGKARIHLWVVSFTVSFGDSSPSASPITWAEFQTSFLPHKNGVADKENYMSLNPQQGLLKTIEQQGKTTWVINPKEISIVTDSVLPIKKAYYSEELERNNLNMKNSTINLGIAPMDIKADDLSSSFTIKIEREEGNIWKDVSGEFSYDVVTKSVPSALWGTKLLPSVNDKTMVDNVATSFIIKPKNKPENGITSTVNDQVLKNNLPDMKIKDSISKSIIYDETPSVILEKYQ